MLCQSSELLVLQVCKKTELLMLEDNNIKVGYNTKIEIEQRIESEVGQRSMVED